ncbi:hypothetical protein ACLKA6_010894 [Drosophila palustris]
MPDNGLFHAINVNAEHALGPIHAFDPLAPPSPPAPPRTTITTLPHRTELAQDSLCLPFAAGGVKQDGVGT